MKGKSFKHTGKTDGKSNTLGHGGRAEQFNKKLEKEGIKSKYERGAIIGKEARRVGAAPGQKNYHPTKRKK